MNTWKFLGQVMLKRLAVMFFDLFENLEPLDVDALRLSLFIDAME
jgi:hypothetical protein